jgi:LPXTG-motif cell wall-anchored protein
MKATLFSLGCMVALALAIVGSGIRPAEAAGSTQASEPPSSLALAAGDQAIAYINTHYGPQVQVPEGLSGWTVQDTTSNVIGVKDYRFTSGEWVMAMHYPLAGPQNAIYTIEVTNTPAGFAWTGTVDAQGNVTPTSTGGPGMPSTGTGAQTTPYIALAILGAVAALASGLLLRRRNQALRVWS